MSFIRNPRKYDVRTKKRKIYKRDIDSKISKLDDLLSSHRYYDKATKRKINETVEMIAYLVNHPQRTNLKPTTINKIVHRVENRVKGIKGINIEPVKMLEIPTVG